MHSWGNMKKIRHLLSALGLLALAVLPAAAAQPPTTGYYSITYDTAKATATLQIAGQIKVGVSSMTLSTAKVLIDGTSGFITVSGGSVTASSFFGDGSHLTGVVASPGGVDFSTITTALAGKLSNTAAIPGALIDLSTYNFVTVGITSSCAAGYTISTGTWTNGILTGGGCVAIGGGGSLSGGVATVYPVWTDPTTLGNSYTSETSTGVRVQNKLTITDDFSAPRATFTASITIGTTTSAFLYLDGPANGNPEIVFRQNGAERAYIYYYDAISKLVVGRTRSSTSGMTFDASDNVTIGASLSVSSLTVNGYDILGAWYSWVPTPTCVTGTATSISATGRYQKFGKTVHYEAEITLTTIGTCGGGLYYTLPFTTNQYCGGMGRNMGSGEPLITYWNGASTTMIVYKYDGNAPTLTNGHIYKMSNTCEVQ